MKWTRLYVSRVKQNLKSESGISVVFTMLPASRPGWDVIAFSERYIALHPCAGGMIVFGTVITM